MEPSKVTVLYDVPTMPVKQLNTCVSTASLGSETTTGSEETLGGPGISPSSSPAASPREEVDDIAPVLEKSSVTPRSPCCNRQIDAVTGQKWTLVVDEHGREKYYDQELASTFVKGAFSKAHTISPREQGKVRNIVRDKDGRITALGDDSIYDEATMKRWVAAMGTWHLKGFEQELRFRVSDIYKEYAELKGQLDDYLENADYIFFGLDKDATLQDLDREYRRLAKLMHPDKNGGSDEAKAKFQDMKQRYEALRKKIRQANGESTAESPREIMDEGQELDQHQPAENNDDDEEDSVVHDRDRHEKIIWDLYHAAKTMERQILQIKGKLA